ncbi:ATP-dependent RecD-like DNA helicase [Mycolicibacterium vanbaalenii]|uniref:ATP-dependent RecD-like DNA helicase n=2 Tax=Mycolicibacterium vanbaalenii TaxID=110539 RepID=A0A5S9R0P7_MYCVN|nr:ATP-dependent RecD-like DNA helicase [Mycolicibacterium vanbaalenii]
MPSVTATCHKLTAGDGYEYLTRQVAVHDSTEKGRMALADYYHAKGESPGQWIGSGLAALHQPVGRELTPEQLEDWIVEEGSEVTADQMKALFGLGQHPNAEKIATKAVAAGIHPDVAKTIGNLGRPFPIYTGASEYRKACAEAFSTYNESIGRPRDAAVDPEVRATIRTDVANEMFVTEYGRSPDQRELAGFIAKQSRPATTAVAGNDVTFTPVKSAATLWAVAPTPVREQIERAHEMAWRDALRSAEENALFSRMGAGGIAQVDTHGFIGTAFVHRDSRAGDPNLHTHVALSNKVLATGTDGIPRWLAMDGRPFYKSIVAMSETYNSRFEAYMIEFLGVEFAETPTEPGKRPIREIVGISRELIEFWSKRAKMIDDRLAQLTIKFQQEVGREPTAAEAYDLSQRATLETRDAKKSPRSFAEQRHTWHDEAVHILGSEHALAEMLTTTLDRSHEQLLGRVSDEWVTEHGAAILATLAETRAKWQWAHVHAEAWRIARAEGVAHQSDIAQRLTTAALGQSERVASSSLDGDLAEPDFLRRRNGESVYTTHGTDMYTSAEILAAERRIVAAATSSGARSLDHRTIEIALLEHAANNDFALNAGQAAMVRQLGSSRARVRLCLAPAGTGKTASMNVLGRAWTDSGGSVLGLAPTASAAKVLGDDIHSVADTLAKYVYCVQNPEKPTPAWFDKVGRDTLIVLDEAGMAATLDLDVLIAHAQSRGATVVLIGDDQQLASISAGGVLRDIAHETGAVTLSALVRFKDQAEGAAGLALRDGDTAAIGFYIDHDRVHIGSDAAAADMAYKAWHADRAAGVNTIMLAPTTDTVAELNNRAQADRIARDGITGRGATLRDGATAYAGDIVFTRKNARWLPLSRTDHVRNRYRWTVRKVGKDGSVTVQLLGNDNTPGRTVRLPADYAADHLTLGYAATVHAAQGMTVMTCHLVGASTLTRQLLYVAMTRGRLNNHIYFSTAEHDPHKIVSRKAVVPDTATDVLSSILAHDGAQQSATTAAREARNPFTRLAHAAPAYSDAVGSSAEHHVGPGVMADIDSGSEKLLPGLTQYEAWPALRKQLALIALENDGSATETLHTLQDAINSRELDTAYDVAAVLHWRIRGNLDGGPLPWMITIPTQLPEPTRHYLHARHARVRELATEVHEQAMNWTPATVPVWARALHAVAPDLTARVAVWRAALGVEDADRRITGPRQYSVATRRYQKRLDAAVESRLHEAATVDSNWRDAIERIEPRILTDPYWPDLTEHLGAADRAGLNVPQLLAAVSDRPLPDEMPAAALWWRLSRELAPATTATAHSYQRPEWTPHLYRLLGPALAEYTLADPAWPALVAAIESADPTQWRPTELLDAAHDLLHAGARGHHVRPNEWAQALTWRVELLLSPIPDIDLHHGDIEPPLTPEQQEQAAAHFPDPQATPPTTPVPEDHHRADEEYLSSLQDLAPPEDELHLPEPHLADDEYGSLAFDDLSPHRPDPATPDLVALWESERTLRHQLDELTAAAADPSHWATPHLAAFRDQYATLLTEFRRQQPHHEAITAAYQDWIAADRAVQAAQARLDDPARPTPAGDQITDDDPARHEHLAAVAAEHNARQSLADARDALHTFLDGAQPVTDDLLNQLVQHAADADNQLIADTRARLTRTSSHVRAAEHTAALAYAHARRSTDPQRIADELTQTRLEYTLLEDAAARPARTPRLAITADGLDATQTEAAAMLGRSPYTLNILTGDHTATQPVLHALAGAAQQHQRPLIVVGATDTAVTDALAAGLAPTGYRADQIPTAALDSATVLIPDAATWNLHTLHAVATQGRAAHAKLILTGDTETAASSPQFRTLAAELPWTQTADTPTSALLADDTDQRRAAARQLTDDGDLTTIADMATAQSAAIDAYRRDLDAGLDTVIVTTPALAAELNTRIHDQRGGHRHTLGWHQLGPGDIITTTAPTETAEGSPITSGGRWRITALDPATHTAHAQALHDPSLTITIDPQTQIELGYAQTHDQYSANPRAQRVHLLTETPTERTQLAPATSSQTHLYVIAPDDHTAQDAITTAAEHDHRPTLGLDAKLAAAQHHIAHDQPVTDIDQLALRLADKRDELRATRTTDHQHWIRQQQRLIAARHRATNHDHHNHGPDLSR